MGGDAGSVGAPASRVVSAETRAIPPWTSRPGRHLQEEASASERPGSASREELCSVRARSAVRRSRRSPSAGPASVGWGRRGRRSTHLHGDRLAPCADWSPVAGHTGCSPTCATAGGQQGGGDRATRSRVCSARRARGSDRKQRGARGSVLDTHLLVLIPDVGAAATREGSDGPPTTGAEGSAPFRLAKTAAAPRACSPRLGTARPSAQCSRSMPPEAPRRALICEQRVERAFTVVEGCRTTRRGRTCTER